MKLINEELLNALTAKAKQSERKRTHHNLHESEKDDYHRLCVAAEPGTYVRPHRHSEPGKWELLIILRGSARFNVFADDGRLVETVELDSKGDNHCCEIDSGVWHNSAILESGSVLMEVKKGPYEPIGEEDCAQWAPAEGESGVETFETWYRTASQGDLPPERQTIK